MKITTATPENLNISLFDSLPFPQTPNAASTLCQCYLDRIANPAEREQARKELETEDAESASLQAQR